jgi:hypothetical protein
MSTFKYLSYLIALFIVVLTACSAEKDTPVVDEQSYVRWHVNDGKLEVYVVLSNPSKQDVTFEASFVLLNETLRDAVGADTIELTSDDRGNTSPFVLESDKESAFKSELTLNRSIPQEILSNGVGIRLSTSERTYIVPIRYIDIVLAEERWIG